MRIKLTFLMLSLVCASNTMAAYQSGISEEYENLVCGKPSLPCIPLDSRWKKHIREYVDSIIDYEVSKVGGGSQGSNNNSQPDTDDSYCEVTLESYSKLASAAKAPNSADSTVTIAQYCGPQTIPSPAGPVPLFPNVKKWSKTKKLVAILPSAECVLGAFAGSRWGATSNPKNGKSEICDTPNIGVSSYQVKKSRLAYCAMDVHHKECIQEQYLEKLTAGTYKDFSETMTEEQQDGSTKEIAKNQADMHKEALCYFAIAAIRSGILCLIFDIRDKMVEQDDFTYCPF